MKKIVKASLIALSAVLATSAVAAVSAPHAVSAKKKKPVKKIDEAQFKKLSAALDKANAEFTKQQASLVKKLTQSRIQLLKQLQDALAQAQKPAPAEAAAPAPTEPTAPVPTTAPTGGTTTDPAATTSPYKADAALVALLEKLADEDESFSGLFPGKQLDKASSQAERWLATDKQLDKSAATAAKLKTGFDEAVKAKNYSEALKIQTQQVELTKQVNKSLGSMLTSEHLLSVSVQQAVSPDNEEDDDEKGEHENRDRIEHKHGHDDE
ncbi:hypothetical protein E5161_09300 [Cohnella pontilimi]|uniref:DUF5667 domain-containing protein n=1 Tax=Cohnella pontilimi TaxID=2564100 RepID=A0A4U0FBN4_9BACL|nr:hypothetical protein [Cohnella pontilimi]TJY42195.1 hypothetical protein E5161_09300 [Cohnella pontilimi]